MNTVTKKTRGRPRGSFSFVNVTLAELNTKYNQTETIPVGRLWLQGKPLATSFSPVESKETSVTIPATSAAPKEPENKVEMKLIVD